MFDGPYAPLQAARVVPCRLIDGVPTATAKWSGPVSDPTKRAARRASSASSWIDVRGARRPHPPLVATIHSANAFSASPAQTATVGSPQRLPSHAATSPYRPAGHCFDGQLAPGFTR